MSQSMPPLRSGHHLRLLEGSIEYFPALVAAIDAAEAEVWLETYIFDFTGSGADVAYALERAARRGVAVQVVVDGFGTPELPPAWRMRFDEAGVRCLAFFPPGPLGLLWPRQWRRMHRKLCVVDRAVGFCGGINVLDDFHDPNHGALAAPRLDFAVRVTGPLLEQMHATMARQWRRLEAVNRLRQAQITGAMESLLPPESPQGLPPAPPPLDGPARSRAALALRDNVLFRRNIEQAYRRAIGRAQREIIVANAYFVPGRKMRRALISAARRGVRVVLLLQGRYEYFMQYYAARPVFGPLLRAGVEIYEYAPSFLHAKVAVIDGHWATVGSSNLDPLSFLLAREANIVVEDEDFAGHLRARLLHAMRHEGKRMDPADYANRPLAQRAKERLALVVMRVLIAIHGQEYL
jgi:cardiolipin synthase